MRALSALRDGIAALRRSPAIVGVAFLLASLATAASGAQAIDPLYSYPALGALYLLLPFVGAGLLAHVATALDGASAPGVFVAAGKDAYGRLLGGGIAVGAIVAVVYVVVVVFASVAVTVLLLRTDHANGFSTGATVALAAIGLVAFAGVSLPAFLFQFFPAAVVYEDAGLSASFRRSLGLVREHFVSVLGFTVVAFLLGLVNLLPSGYLFWVLYGTGDAAAVAAAPFEALTRTQLAVYLGASLVTATVVASVTYPYYAAFFRRLPGTDAGRWTRRAADGGTATTNVYDPDA